MLQKVEQVIASHRPPRDRSLKVLRLLEYSTQASQNEALETTLGVLLLSLMGEFAATGGTVLLRGPDGHLRASAIRGRVPNIDRQRYRAPEHGDADGLSALQARIQEDLALELVVPLSHRQRALGMLGLAARAGHDPYTEQDIELVRLVGGIAATTVANHQLYEELRQVNRQLERRVFDLHAMFDISRDLNGSLEPEGIFRVVAQTVMAHLLVSRCAILMEADDRIDVAFSRGLRLDPSLAEALAQASFAEAAPSLASGSPHDIAILLHRAGAERLVPLRSGEVVRGFLGIGSRQDGRAISDEELAFLSTLGNQAVTALDNLRLHVDQAQRERLERELAIARDIQKALLPARLPRVVGYELAVESEPCFEVGGDYYDALSLPHGVLLAVGDVAGKSVPAALLMSVLQATVRSLAGRPGETTTSLVRQLNTHLVASTQPAKFASFFLAVLDPATGALAYTNAGHNPPLLLHQGGQYERLQVGGPVLGVFDDAEFECGHAILGPGDLLFAYTDGITEAVDTRDDEFGEARLIEHLCANLDQDADTVLAVVVRAVADHACGLERGDDITALAVRRVQP